ncbi:MAG TPA: MarR family winged helix-turn-helix transcriptional regulator [Luteibacter sp.]|uniref:MarR family winged helix-turn-helix transcriptional regulator n=1 Tax=Luteibacter sp. TaxID=1886636 RepID=UPI002BDD87FD|nr:MarR family winged helix-turn-helix transcriptional regulator [Luteibacter sp.]HVI53551.1 MarR family winged helix-turn-helix transcriptional regulator [Luteibacter sp.]
MSATELPCACTTMRKATRALSRLYDDTLAPLGVTVAQFGILKAIRREPGLALSRLADDMVMDRTSLYRMLTPMRSAGWIAIAAPTKGRAKTVALTAEGEALLTKARLLWDDAQTRVVGTYGADRWQALERAISELTRLSVGLNA